MKDEPFDAISPTDGFVATRVTFYAALYPTLRQRARELGYALCLHGSLTKDLDLLAVPWTIDSAPAEDLVRALTDAAGGYVRGSASERPHGRRAWTIMLARNGGYLDLSVMPRDGDPRPTLETP